MVEMFDPSQSIYSNLLRRANFNHSQPANSLYSITYMYWGVRDLSYTRSSSSGSKHCDDYYTCMFTHWHVDITVMSASLTQNSRSRNNQQQNIHNYRTDKNSQYMCSHTSLHMHTMTWHKNRIGQYNIIIIINTFILFRYGVRGLWWWFSSLRLETRH